MTAIDTAVKTARDSERLRIGAGGAVPIRWDASKSEPGTLTGWASVYNVVDQQDDVVTPGAFRKTLQEWRASKRVIPLTLDHQNTAEGVIGSLVDAEESAYGLRVTFKFANTSKAQDARSLARDGHLNGLSIFGPIIQKAFDTVAGKSVRILKEVGLMFVGLTPIPANVGSLVTAAKSDDEDASSSDDVWVTDMRAALAIAARDARDAAVNVLVKHRFADTAAAAGSVPEEDTPHSEPDGDAAKNYAMSLIAEPDPGFALPEGESAYAMSVIGESGPAATPPGGEPSDSLAGLIDSVDMTDTKSELDGLEAELRSESRDHHPPEGSD